MRVSPVAYVAKSAQECIDLADAVTLSLIHIYPHFPDTIYDVIYQKNQFAGMYGDRITRCYVKDELVPVSYTHLDVYKRQDQYLFQIGH